MVSRNSKKNGLAYKCFADLNDAGLPVLTSLENLKQTSRFNDGTVISGLIHHVRKGEFLHGAMQRLGRPPLEVALVKVGEKTGNLTTVSRFLSEFYEERHKIEQSLKSAAIKPGLLFLASVFLRDLPSMVAGEMTILHYILKTFLSLALVGSVGFAIYRIYRITQRSRAAASWWYSLFRKVPWLGHAIETSDLERFFTCLSLGLAAGCDFPSMLEIAGEMTVLPEVRSAARQIAVSSRKVGFAEAMRQTGVFRHEQLMVIQTGETSGKLEEALKNLCSDLRAEVKKNIATFEDWMPKIVYGIAMIYAITGIFSTLSAVNRIRDVNIGG